MLRPIYGKKINLSIVDQVLTDFLVKHGERAVKHYKDATHTWTHAPSGWRIKVEKVQKDKYITVRPFPEGSEGGRIFEMVDSGARSHPIYPIRGRGLSFQEGYVPKTVPWILASRQGGKFGARVRRAFIPNHPGFEARNFRDAVKSRYGAKFAKEFNSYFTQRATTSSKLYF